MAKFMIKTIKYEQIPFFGNKECKKLGIIFTSNYKYLGFFKNNEIVGVVGYKTFKNNTAYIGGSYVLQSFRNEGIYELLHSERLKILKNQGIKSITANLTVENQLFHLKRGAKVVKKYNNNIIKVLYDNF
jgi:hypothetical protein